MGMRLTGFSLRRLFGDWRFLLAFILLFFLCWWELAGGMRTTISFGAFMRAHSFVSADSLGQSLGLTGSYDTAEAMWEAFVNDPEIAQYYYLCALCNTSLAPFIANVLLSVWIIGYGIRKRAASEMLLRGGSRRAVFLQLLLPYLFCALLVRWGVAFGCFMSFPIRWEYIPPEYRRQTVSLWLLITAEDVCLSAFIAFAVGPFAAIGLNLCRMLEVLLPAAVRRALPFMAAGAKDLFKPENAPAALYPAAAVAAAVTAASLLGSWLVFRKKDL